MNMIPEIFDAKEAKGVFTFTLKNVNTSIANGLRRILLSEIPTIVCMTNPHEKNQCTIHKNTTRLNNEIIKQRLSCVPIHIDDVENFPKDEYILEVNVTNEGAEIIYVTTEHFTLKNISTGQYLPSNELSTIFPKNTMTEHYIDLVRLRPRISETIAGEAIHLESKLSIGTAKMDSMFNAVSTSAYGLTQDIVAANEAWNKMEEEMTKNGANRETVEFEKANFKALEAKRFVIPDSFDFNVETIGIYKNRDLVKKGCSILMDKFQSLIEVIDNNLLIINEADVTMKNCYDIILEHEDYTMGKVVEYFMFQKYFETEKKISYCGFKKFHPHDDYSIIRVCIAKVEEESKETQDAIPETKEEEKDIVNVDAHKELINQMMKDVATMSIDVYDKIKMGF